MVDRTITLMRYSYKTGHKNTEIRKHVEKEEYAELVGEKGEERKK